MGQLLEFLSFIIENLGRAVIACVIGAAACTSGVVCGCFIGIRNYFRFLSDNF